jgi:hypothetical protein
MLCYLCDYDLSRYAGHSFAFRNWTYYEMMSKVHRPPSTPMTFPEDPYSE